MDINEKLDHPDKVVACFRTIFGWNEADTRQELGLEVRPEAKQALPRAQPNEYLLDPLLALCITGRPAAPRELADYGEAWWHWRENYRFDIDNAAVRRIEPALIRDEIGRSPYFVHLDLKDPKKIIYTPSAEYGRADRRVVTTMGRFLTKHFSGSYDAGRIKQMAEDHNATYGDPVVHFAFGADDIVTVYKNGPRSCMNNETSYPLAHLSEHPAAIYDGPDTAQAFIKKADGSVSARTLVRLDKTPMTFGRIYGDDNLLRTRLMSFGFKNVAASAGVRLRRVLDPQYNRLLCPYLDGEGRVNDDGEFLVVAAQGKICAQNTSGVCGDNSLRVTAPTLTITTDDDGESDFYCSHCDEGFGEGDRVTTVTGDSICCGCADDTFSFVIGTRHGDHRWVYSEDIIWVDDTGYYNDDGVLAAFGIEYSEYFGEHIDTRDNRYTYIASAEDWMPTEEACECVDRDDWWDRADCTQLADGTWVHDDDKTEIDGIPYHVDYLPEDSAQLAEAA